MKRANKSESRLPSKRVKKEPSRFISYDEETPSPTRRKSIATPVKKELLYNRCAFLAVKNEAGDFYLCQALQNVFDATTQFRIRWLNKDTKTGLYKVEYVDVTQPDCIITDVKLKREEKDVFSLPESSLEEIREAQKEAEEAEEEEEEEEEVEEEEVVEEPPPPKKQKVAEKPPAKKNRVISVKLKKPTKSKANKLKKAKAKVVVKVKPPVEKKVKVEVKIEKNPKIKVLEKDPLFENRDDLPYISSSAHSKLVFRAVCLKDYRLLQQLIDDVHHVHRVNMPQSVTVTDDALDVAIKREDIKAIQMLTKELFNIPSTRKPRQRVGPPVTLLKAVQTGYYNPVSLGIPIIRTLQMSRGSREGNNALIKDNSLLEEERLLGRYVQTAMKRGVQYETIVKMLEAAGDKDGDNKGEMFCYIYEAVRNGHYKLAGRVLEEYEKIQPGWFSFLHKEVLLFEKQDLRPLKAASVKKKPWDNMGITPIHCAAINPNTKYLLKLLSVLPEYNITDKSQRRPIHYAAASVSPKAMEYLLSRGVSVDEVDTSGMTPLMIASQTGRLLNVEVLLKHAQTGKKKKDEFSDKYGTGGVNRPNRYSYTALHMAIMNGNLNIMRVLIKYGADINLPLSASKNKLTPLMLACERGVMSVVRYLVLLRAPMEAKDKMKRTALMHAVINGHANVASYLLSLGADPNHADTSGNTVILYAAAYGWYFCLRLLLTAGADPNKANDWKVTPLGIAFLKGHIGLADVLLGQKGVDINFPDDSGMTLLAIACASSLEKGLPEQIRYLLKHRRANASVPDVNGNTALHHIASNSIKKEVGWQKYEVCHEQVERSINIAKQLLDAGCDPTLRNKEGLTPVMCAIKQANSELVKLLVERGGSISTEVDQTGSNVLHLMADQCMQENLAPLLHVLGQKKGDENEDDCPLVVMSKVVDNKGFTPFLRACYRYYKYDAKHPHQAEDDEDDEDKDTVDVDDIDEENGNSEDADEAMDTEEITQNGPSNEEEAGDGDEDMEDEEAEDEEEKKKTTQKVYNGDHWEEGRQFIRALIDVCKSDVNATVQKKVKVITKPTVEPVHLYSPGGGSFMRRQSREDCEEESEYFEGFGKTSALYFLLGTKNEPKAAVEAGGKKMVNPALQMLLSYKPSLDNLDMRGYTALIKAIEMKNAEVADLMVVSGADVNVYVKPPTEKKNNKDKTDIMCPPLIQAIVQGLEGTVALMLDNGANVMSRDKDGNTAMHMLAQFGRGFRDTAALVKKMLTMGVGIDPVNNHKQTPLHLAVNSNSGGADATSEMEEFLVEQGADVFAEDTDSRLPLHYALVKMGSQKDKTPCDPIELVSMLTEAMIDRKIDHADKNGQTPLHLSAYRGATVCAMHLLQRKADINAKDVNGNTPLGMAVTGGQESCAILLTQKNANINVNVVEAREAKKKDPKEKPEWKWKPLRTAGEGGKKKEYPLFQAVVQNGWQGVIYMMIDLLSKYGMSYGQTIEAALITGNYHLALTLIRKMKEDKTLQWKNSQQQNLLHVLTQWAKPGAQKDVQLRVAEKLLGHGLVLTEADKFGATPLTYANLNQHYALATFILDNAPGIAINQADIFGRTAFAASFWKADSCDEELVKKMLRYKASPDVLCDYPLSDQPVFGNDTLAICNDTDNYHQNSNATRISPLILAVTLNNFNLAKFLLSQGASVNFADENKMTPMMYAVRANNVSLVKLLLNHSYKKGEGSDEPVRKPPLKKKTSRRAFTLGRGRLREEEIVDMGNEEEEDEEENEQFYAQTAVPDSEINMEIQPFSKVSEVDLGASDVQGWTVIHHVVSPMAVGTYDNVLILKLLVDAGADFNAKDKAGLAPLDYALIRGAPKLAKALQTLMEKPQDKWEKPTFSKASFEDGVKWEGPAPDFRADAEAELEKQQKEALTSVKTDSLDPLYQPDDLLQMTNTAEVVHDAAQNLPYSSLLTKIDVSHHAFGLYNFYKLQLVRQKGKDMYILFTRWGRIGSTGNHQQTPFQKEEDGVHEFCKIFKSKTGNDWNNLSGFEDHPGKYRLVHSDERKKCCKLQDVPLSLKSDLPSKLSEPVKEMLKDITDVTVMHRFITRAHIDTEALPFGQLKKEALEAAKGRLQRLMTLAKDIEKFRGEPITGPAKQTEYQEKCLQVSKLTNEYYHMVPQFGFEYEQVLPLDNCASVTQELLKVHDLMELEFASKILLGAQNKVAEMNPLDYVYRSVGAHIEQLHEDDVETQYLLKFIHNSERHRGKVESIFRVCRQGEEDTLRSCGLDNHYLLFHGSGTHNLLSILGRGLLVAPIGADTAGYAFGKGIYTADSFGKSYAYCDSWASRSDTKYMLVCQVALGKAKGEFSGKYMEEAEEGFNSTVGIGREMPDKTFDVTLPTGAIMRLGNLLNRTEKEIHHYLYLHYNEFIVYSAEQVCLRYIIQFK